MLETKNILDIIILLGAVQGLIFAIYTWMKPFPNRKASLFLALFILSFSLNSSFNAFEGLGFRNEFNVVNFLPFYCTLLIILSFHFFIHFLTHSKDSFNLKKWIIISPAGIQILFQLTCLSILLINKNILLSNEKIIYSIYSFFDVVTAISGAIVLICAFVRIREYDQVLKKNYAEISDFSLSWITTLLKLLLIVWILFLIPTLLELFTNLQGSNLFYPLWIFSSVLIYWIGYSAYARRNQLAVQLYTEKENAIHHKTLSDKTDSYYQSLLTIMDHEKLHRNPELNLKMLSDRMQLSSGYLSQIINRNEGKNFFEFINAYRVDDVKELLQNEELSHLSLLGIAYEAGFKSKSTFNLAFKKITGQTPSAYKKSLGTDKS